MKMIVKSIKDYIKQEYKAIIFIVVFAIIMNIPVNYTIFTDGGIINVNDRVSIENEYKQKGSFNLAYVNEVKGNVLTYALSYIIPSWERLPLSDFKVSKKESSNDISKRGLLSLENSKQSAIKIAYQKAGKEFNYNSVKYSVYGLSEEYEGDLKIGDVIVGYDENKSLIDMDISKDKNDDTLTLLIKRDDKEIKTNSTIKTIDGARKLGIYIIKLYNYTVNPKIKFSFKSSEEGPSGGLMLTLSIYNKLIEEDITHGKRIVGTGTIDEAGEVGSIDGVKYKLKGAVDKNADVFIVPSGKNYEECMSIKEEKNYNIKIIGVSSFDDALEKLQELK